MYAVPEIRSHGFCCLKTDAHVREMTVHNMGRAIVDWFEKSYLEGTASSLQLVCELIMMWRECFMEFLKDTWNMRRLVSRYNNIFVRNTAFRKIQKRGCREHLYVQWWAVLEALRQQLTRPSRVSSFSRWLRTQKFLDHFLDEGLGSKAIFGKAASVLQVSQFRLGRFQRRRRDKRADHFLRSYCRLRWRPSYRHLRD